MKKENLNDLELTKEDYEKLIESVFYKRDCLIKEYKDEFDPFFKNSIYEDYREYNKLYLKLIEKYKTL